MLSHLDLTIYLVRSLSLYTYIYYLYFTDEEIVALRHLPSTYLVSKRAGFQY